MINIYIYTLYIYNQLFNSNCFGQKFKAAFVRFRCLATSRSHGRWARELERTKRWRFLDFSFVLHHKAFTITVMSPESLIKPNSGLRINTPTLASLNTFTEEQTSSGSHFNCSFTLHLSFIKLKSIQMQLILKKHI